MTNTTIAVRRLQPTDSALAVETVRRLKSPDGYPVPTARYVKTLLSRQENVLIVAEEAGVPIGYAVAYVLDRIDRDQRMMFFMRSASPNRPVGVELVAA